MRQNSANVVSDEKWGTVLATHERQDGDQDRAPGLQRRSWVCLGLYHWTVCSHGLYTADSQGPPGAWGGHCAQVGEETSSLGAVCPAIAGLIVPAPTFTP